MENVILYIDCDGVILDTIQTGYRMMGKLGLDINDAKEVNTFFVNTDWNILIYEAGILRRATTIIRNIVRSKQYKDVVILTKTSGSTDEEKVKRILFGKILSDVSVIAVNFLENKDEVVDPVGNILIDDSVSNVCRWNKAGGIGILFVRENPNFAMNEIANLNDIMKTDSIKRLVKTRNI